MLKNLSKKQLEKLLQTLEKEIQYQSNSNNSFLAFMGLILLIIFYLIPIVSSRLDDEELILFSGRTYQLEIVDRKMTGKEFDNYPDGVTGSYKVFDSFDSILFSFNMGIVIYVAIFLYYFNTVFSSWRLYKVYKLARYIHSLK